MFVSSRRLNLLNVNQLLLNQGGITSSYAITPGDYLASHWGHGDSRIHCLNLPVRGVIFGTPLQGGNPFTIPLGWQGLALFLEGAAGVIFYDCWFTGGCYAYYFRIASWEPHSGPEILSSHQPRNCEVFWGGGPYTIYILRAWQYNLFLQGEGQVMMRSWPIVLPRLLMIGDWKDAGKGDRIRIPFHWWICWEKVMKFQETNND